jgi:hypothetical protein
MFLAELDQSGEWCLDRQTAHFLCTQVIASHSRRQTKVQATTSAKEGQTIVLGLITLGVKLPESVKVLVN